MSEDVTRRMVEAFCRVLDAEIFDDVSEAVRDALNVHENALQVFAAAFRAAEAASWQPAPIECDLGTVVPIHHYHKPPYVVAFTDRFDRYTAWREIEPPAPEGDADA